MKSYSPLSVKLDTEADQDIIEFLRDKPKSFVVKTALRRYMKESGEHLEAGPVQTQASKSQDNEPDVEIL